MIDQLPVLDELERRLIDGCYPPSGRTRRPWRWASAGVIVVACAVVIVLLTVGSGGGAPSAAMALDRAAAVVARTASHPPLRAGDYWYTRTILSSREPLPIVPRRIPAGQTGGQVPLVWFDTRESIETWIGLDGTLRDQQTQLSARFASAADRARWRAAKQTFPQGFGGTSDSITVGDGRFPPQLSGGLQNPGDGLFSYRQLISLPTSVAQLRVRIEQAQAALQARLLQGLRETVTQGPGVRTLQLRNPLSAAQTRASSGLQAIAALLAAPVPASLRAALFRVAATLPGITYQGKARDPIGRTGVAISVGTGGYRTRMIFDPNSGELLANAQGTDLISTVVAQGVVDSINQLPANVAPVPGTPRQAPQLLTISPRVGDARTLFTLTLPAPRSASQHGRAPLLAAYLLGPTGPGCRFWASRSPFARIPPGSVTRHSASSRTYTYRLGPPAIGQSAWCPGRYQLQATPFQNNQPITIPDQTGNAIYFEVR